MITGPAHFYDTPAPRGRPPKYPVRHLKVGESAYFAGAEAHRVGASIRQCAPMQFECKTIIRNGLKHAKVTRIA